MLVGVENATHPLLMHTLSQSLMKIEEGPVLAGSKCQMPVEAEGCAQAGVATSVPSAPAPPVVSPQLLHSPPTPRTWVTHYSSEEIQYALLGHSWGRDNVRR